MTNNNIVNTCNRLAAFCLSVAMAGMVIFSAPLAANPQNGVVIAGNATITNNGTVTEIKQTTDKAIINWDGFSINTAEETRFHQPSSNSITLNRVVGKQASRINGNLKANGKIMLVNPSGIIFGAGSKVDVAGLIATTAKINDGDFMAGNYKFIPDQNNSAAIINNGDVTVADRGLVVLVAPGVENNGTIRANVGKVALASGNSFTVDMHGDQLIQYDTGAEITQTPVDANGRVLKHAVNNTGAIYADGGQVLLSARAVENIVDNAVNMEGVVQVRTVGANNGTIVLSGENNTVNVSGTLDASGQAANTTGGKIKVLGKKVQIKETAIVDASGDAGGGEILIGGNFQGKGPELNAKTTVVEKGAKINASAVNKGNGGKVIVWADDRSQYAGAIKATGGQQGGDGGFAEISGKKTLSFAGKVDLTAPQGKTGDLLLDPYDLTISDGATNVNNIDGTYTSNHAGSIVNVLDLFLALQSANITIQTGGVSAEEGNITVASDITWNTSNTLTLLAAHDVIINSGILISNSSGGSLILYADTDANGTGIVSFPGSGIHVSMSGGGSTKIYYKPSSYGSPINYSDKVSGDLTAYMLVNTYNDLTHIADNLNGTYALGRDIDASGSVFTPLGGNDSFTGNFDGQGYAITGLHNASTGGHAGLFAYTDSATIENLKLLDVVMTGDVVGALVGTATDSTIRRVYSSGTITATDIGDDLIGIAGGLVGFNVSDGASSIDESFSTADVTGSTSVGGLVGTNGSGTISNSYAQGKVTLTSSAGSVGGLIGSNFVLVSIPTVVSNSYSTSLVTAPSGTANVGGLVGSTSAGTVNSSYWDVGTSGQSTSAGGTGQNTSNLMVAATYSGWDFTDTWGIIEGVSYPYLQWHYPSAPQIISGTAYSDAGITGAGNKTIAITSGSSTIATLHTTANGFYYLPLAAGTIAAATPLLLYFKGESITGNTVINFDGSYASNLSTYTNSVIAGGSGVVTNAVLNAAKSGNVDSGILYSYSGSTLTLNSNTQFISDAPYSLSGNIITSNQAITFNNTFDVAANSALNGSTSTFNGAVGGTHDLTITGNATFNSTVDSIHTLHITNISTFNGLVGSTAAVHSIHAAGATTINTAAINTKGAQTYAGAVHLTADATLTDTGSTGIYFNDTLNGVYNLTLSAPQAAINFAAIVGGNQALETLTINNANNVTANAALYAASFIQAQGSGTTTFNNLIATHSITINTNQINGLMNANRVSLMSINGINGTVIANSLALGGTGGSNLINTIVNGYSGIYTAEHVSLLAGSSGDFLVNGCSIGINCSAQVSNIVNATNASVSIISNEVNTETPYACTVLAAVQTGQSANDNCPRIENKTTAI